MHTSGRRMKSFGVLALAGMVFLSGCATKKWVRQEVAPIGPRITTVENAGKENAERIDSVDQKAQQGISAVDAKAAQAGAAAATAQTTAADARQQADTANSGVQQANSRINTIEGRLGSLDTYALSGEPASITFKSGSAVLSDEAKTALDGIASDVTGHPSGYIIELQGYADAQGAESYNEGLSQRRAEAVLRYLVSKDVPLFRISIVGLGEANPIAPNNTRAGREQNRRVEVRTLRAGGAGTTTN